MHTAPARVLPYVLREYPTQMPEEERSSLHTSLMLDRARVYLEINATLTAKLSTAAIASHLHLSRGKRNVRRLTIYLKH